MTNEGHKVLPDCRHLVSSETLRFRSFDEITRSLHGGGFEIDDVWGDWDRSPRSDWSPEFIVLASVRA